MEITNKITKYLKNLRSTKASPSSGIPQGVQAFTTVFLGLLTSFGIFTMFGNSAYAASYINVSSGSGGTVSLGSIKPSATGVSASGSDTLTITTNCSAGYSVYVSAQNGGDTNLTNTNSSVATNNTISASSTAVGSTATALSSNTWGITGDSASASASKYVGLPSYADATNTALISNSSASTTGDNKSTVYYGVKVDTTLSPGTYSGDVLYTTLVSDKCNNYTVHFNANGGSGSMSDQTIPVGTATNLTMNTFTRSGYAFLGWATSASGKTGTTTNGIGTEADVDYRDGQSVTDISSFNSTINLYAIWLAVDGDMQSFSTCAGLSVGESKILRDTRDNKPYAIKKLPDGKCWMVQNLRLANYKLTPADSDVSTDFDLTTGVTYSGSSGWCKNNNATCVDAKAVYYNSSEASDSSQSSYYGALYNWYTATAGTGTYSTGADVDATSSICPRGWRLPKGGSDKTTNEFSILDRAWGGTGGNRNNANTYNIFTSAYETSNNGGFGLAGYIYGSVEDVGSDGGYWSSTAQSASSAYQLDLGKSNAHTYFNIYFKYVGDSVRCIADYDYLISYSSDGSDSGEPSKASDGAVLISDSVQMPTQGTLTKDGYEFKGWALTSGTSDPTYTAEQTVSVSDLITAASSAGQTPTPGSTITLYPVWTQSVVYMQDWSGCSALAESESVTLVDSRDNKEYAVKKLPDGKCWMMQNLTIGSTGAQTLTPENTNIDDGKTYYLPPAGKQGSSTIDDSSTLTATDAANFASSADQHAKTQFRMKDSNIANDSDTGYYNFYTATLGYSWYGTGSSGSSTRDICPKNWRLPKTTDSGSNVTTVGSVNDFTYLALQYNSTTGWNGSATGTSGYGYYNNNDVVRNPMYKSAASPLATTTRNNYAGFSYSGYWDGSSASVVGSYGSYWSSSVYVTDDGYSLSFSSSSIGPQGGGYKNVGRAVRCVAKDARTLSDIAYMQDINSDIISNTATNTYKQLTDSRDNNKYYVKKLADGKLWMVQNLRLTNYKLTSADSDVSADFDLTTGITYSGSSGWCQNNNATCDNVKALYYNSSEASNSSKSSYYGALYNWYTATAGTGTYFTGANVQASSSICPKGWRLPTGGSSGEFVALDKAWGGTGANRSSANTHGTFTGDYRTGDNGGFGLAGYINGSVDYVGSSGFYWSSTANDASSAYDLSLYKSNADVYPRDYFSKFFGNSVRCIAN